MTDYEFACLQVKIAQQALEDAMLAVSTTDGRGTHERQKIEALDGLLVRAMFRRDALAPQKKHSGRRNQYSATFQ